MTIRSLFATACDQHGTKRPPNKTWHGHPLFTGTSRRQHVSNWCLSRQTTQRGGRLHGRADHRLPSSRMTPVSRSASDGYSTSCEHAVWSCRHGVGSCVACSLSFPRSVHCSWRHNQIRCCAAAGRCGYLTATVNVLFTSDRRVQILIIDY